MMPKLTMLEEEDPELHIVWNEQLQEIKIQIMGEVQIEILKALILSVLVWRWNLAQERSFTVRRSQIPWREWDILNHCVIMRRYIFCWSREKTAAVLPLQRMSVRICWQETGRDWCLPI